MAPWAITEYGGYSLPVHGHLWASKEFGYKKFREQEAFERAYQDLMEEQVKPLIAAGMSAAVYTQLIDMESETNGLITYDRKVLKVGKSHVSHSD